MGLQRLEALNVLLLPSVCWWERWFVLEPVTPENTDSLLSHQVVAEYGSLSLLHWRDLHPLVLWDFEKGTFPTQSCWLYLYTDVCFTDWEAFMNTAFSQSLCKPPASSLTVTGTFLQFFQTLFMSWVVNRTANKNDFHLPNYSLIMFFIDHHVRNGHYNFLVCKFA